MNQDTLSVIAIVAIAFVGGMLIGPLSAKSLLGIALILAAGAYAGKIASTKKLHVKKSAKK